jgi:hypothetical protein
MSTATGFAEMFEWADGNPNREDRTGLTVALYNGDKIRVANANDVPIGVVGGDNTSVAAISNSSPDEWHGKHLRDDYNRLLWEPQSMVEWIVDGYRHWYEADRIPAGIVVPPEATYYHDTWNGHQLKREILSEEYKNPGRVVEPYLPRWERQEWGIVVIAGRVKIKQGQVCNPSWKCLEPATDKSVAEWLIL